MKKMFVVLFPQEEYVGRDKGYIPHFNGCIKRRYQEKGYEVCAVNYIDSDGFVKLPKIKRVDADISFKQSSPYFTEFPKVPDFRKIAGDLKVEGYDEVVVGGYHCFDCVQKLAMEIYALNPNVMIDTELTEMFLHRHRMNDFDIENFNPNQKIDSFLSLEGEPDAWQVERMLKKYSHPIWCITDQYKKYLNDLLESNIEKE